MSRPVKDTTAMISGMDPMRMPGAWHFVSLPESSDQAARLLPVAHAMMREPEGLSLLLDADTAARENLTSELPMAQILLQVHSALDGVGLTAAVSTALGQAQIPCNVIAGARHDHIFVPVSQAETALAILRRTSEASVT